MKHFRRWWLIRVRHVCSLLKRYLLCFSLCQKCCCVLCKQKGKLLICLRIFNSQNTRFLKHNTFTFVPTNGVLWYIYSLCIPHQLCIMTYLCLITSVLYCDTFTPALTSSGLWHIYTLPSTVYWDTFMSALPTVYSDVFTYISWVVTYLRIYVPAT